MLQYRVTLNGCSSSTRSQTGWLAVANESLGCVDTFRHQKRPKPLGNDAAIGCQSWVLEQVENCQFRGTATLSIVNLESKIYVTVEAETWRSPSEGFYKDTDEVSSVTVEAVTVSER